MYCTDSSMVSSSPVPGRDGTVSAASREDDPARRPQQVLDPGVPASSDWYWYSRPDVPLPFQSGRAHHRQGQLTDRLDPLRFGDQVDAREPQVGDRRRHRVGHPVGQVDEPGPLGELARSWPRGPRAPARAQRRWGRVG